MVNKLGTTMTVGNGTMDLTGKQVDAGEQTGRPEAHVFVISGDLRMFSDNRGKIGSGISNGLNARFLII